MKLSILSVFCATVMIPIQSANSQTKPISLRIGDSFPPTHIAVRVLTKPWIERMEELSDGKLKITYYPAEQAGKAKDMLNLTQSGVLDIGYIGPAYVSDRMPLSAVAELPGTYRGACEATRVYWELAKEGGYIFENDFKPNKVRPLVVAEFPSYQVAVSKDKEITGLDDLKGLKIRAAGGAQDLTLNKLNIVPVNMAPPEIYESMSRGTIDGTLLPFISIESYKLTPLIKAATRNINFGAVAVTYTINENKWQELPEDVQDAIVKASEETMESACIAFDEAEKEEMTLAEERGTKFIEFKEEDMKFLERQFDAVATDWAEKLDARGKPGSEALKMFQAAAEK